MCFLALQKRDIQLLKAYMRAIRSANPNLQNLEETIEYNEILEYVSVQFLVLFPCALHHSIAEYFQTSTAAPEMCEKYKP